MKLIWNDEKSVRAWLQSVSKAIRLIADVVDSAMPPAEGAPKAPSPGPPPTGGEPGARSCSFCGKTDQEAQLCVGGQGNICATCTRAACGVLGIALRGEGEPGV